MQDRFKFRYVFTKDFGGKTGICYKMPIFNLDTITDENFNKIVKSYIDYGYKLISIEQCTGLKDKNGKLIYEGDILDLYVSTKKIYRYQVKFEIGSFMLLSDDEIFDFKNVWNDNVYPLSQLYFEYQNEENCIDQCEVVGNIYENSELLEEDQNEFKTNYWRIRRKFKT